jgi:hypothetical protein
MWQSERRRECDVVVPRNSSEALFIGSQTMMIRCYISD